MKIEMKNIQHHKQMSEESNAFSANLYLDGKKVAQVTNRGHGGDTVASPSPGCREAVEEAEKFLAGYGKIDLGDGVWITPDLDYTLSMIAEVDLLKNEIKSELRKMAGPNARHTTIYRKNQNEVMVYKIAPDKTYRREDQGKGATGVDIALETEHGKGFDSICLNSIHADDPDDAFQYVLAASHTQEKADWTVEKMLASAVAP